MKPLPGTTGSEYSPLQRVPFRSDLGSQERWQGMKKSVSLDHLSDYYDILTPTERSRFRRKQIDLIGLSKGDKVLEAAAARD